MVSVFWPFCAVCCSKTTCLKSDSEDDVSVSGSEVEDDELGVEIGDDDVPVSDGKSCSPLLVLLGFSFQLI